MSKIYEVKRAKQKRNSMTAGIVFSIIAHAIILCFGTIGGFKYIYPPPSEENILIDFSEEVFTPEIIKSGASPKAEKYDPKNEIELVQKSEGQVEGTKLSDSQEARVDEFGDVEVAKPKEEVIIDKKSLFNSAKNKKEEDKAVPQTAEKASDKIKAGNPAGNTTIGATDSEPRVKLKGRKVIETPKPSYNVQASGTVVVEIKVDRYGKVTEARPGAVGTTVTDERLWNAARIAAMKAHFKMSGDAPLIQIGTITYVFSLK